MKPPPNVNWCANFSADLSRYKTHHLERATFVILCLESALWALFVFRLSSAVYHSAMPRFVKKPLLVVAVGGQKLMEILTGISLPYRCRIGPGLYIGHFGNIIVHGDVVIGDGCNLSQGVTIGVSGFGERRGVPRIGNRVFVAANAVICGPITVGDGAMIAGNSLVLKDVVTNTTVAGVPARRVNRSGSAPYLS